MPNNQPESSDVDARVMASELSANERTLLLNDYPQDRGIFRRGRLDNFSHLDFFGKTYLEILADLSGDDLFIHIGPGEFFAELEYFTSPCFQSHANVLSNAYRLANSASAKQNLTLLAPFQDLGKLSIIEGVKFQDLKSPAIGSARLITDVFAAASYDSNLFGVFRSASEMLAPGGMFAVVLAGVAFFSAEDERIPFAEVCKVLKGYELFHRAPAYGWIFRRTDEPFLAPTTELLRFYARDAEKKLYWPVRHYRIGADT